MSRETVSRPKVKEQIKALQEVKYVKNDVAGAMHGLPGEVASVGNLIGTGESKSVSKKLIKVGTFLIVAIPEPFISDIAGSALVATGFAMNKFRRKNVGDHYKKFQEDLRQIELIKREIASTL